MAFQAILGGSRIILRGYLKASVAFQGVFGSIKGHLGGLMVHMGVPWNIGRYLQVSGAFQVVSSDLKGFQGVQWGCQWRFKRLHVILFSV